MLIFMKRILEYIFREKFYLIFFLSLFLSISLMSTALIVGFFFSPDDYLQGSLVKIMYIHVPCAWLSLLLYTAMALFSLMYLIKRFVWCDLVASSMSGTIFVLTIVAIITGSIWGKPAWGTWWVWDARLSSMLLLSFLILSYIMIRRAYNNTEVASKICAVVSVVGAINIPIIKFSVNLWNTLHQPASVFKLSGSSVHSSMLVPMFLMFFGMLFFCISITVVKVKTELYIRKARRF
jgi:heme exporter protein C